MSFLRKHWFDLGGILALVLVFYMIFYFGELSQYQTIVWLSLLSLLLHQLEEYRIVGTFPGMVNQVMFKSEQPDRYPLNTNSALMVNVIMGWTLYFLAAILAEKAIWLGMATASDFIAGFVLGIILNVVGILKLIDWMKNPKTTYVFPKRCTLNI